MAKYERDASGEVYQDALTENESKPRPPRRDDAEHVKTYDTDVDSQEGDDAMAENRFGLNQSNNAKR